MQPEAIAELLPEVIRRTAGPGTALADVLGVMSELHRPVEDILDEFERYVDPYRCPERFVPFLAEWVGFGWLVGTTEDPNMPTGDGPLRDVIDSATALSKYRGTEIGLRRMLELATGLTGFDITQSPTIPFHMTVTTDESARPYRDYIALIIRHEKPAFVTADLAIGTDAPVLLVSTNHQSSGGSDSA